MEYTVYLRTNTVNNKQYVGQTGDFKERERSWNCLKTRYANEHIDEDRVKYGFDAWTVEVLAETDNREDAWNLEQRFIKDYNTIWPNGYNLSEGGAGSKGCKPSDETKKKMSEALKGTHRSEETKQKISETLKGTHRPEETKQKISEALKGTQFTEEHKQKISETLKGTHRSEETKQKISETKKIPVYQYTKNEKLVAIWPSAKDAAEKLGIGHISECCHGRKKSAGGYIWSFILLNNNHEASNLAS